MMLGNGIKTKYYQNIEERLYNNQRNGKHWQDENPKNIVFRNIGKRNISTL